MPVNLDTLKEDGETTGRSNVKEKATKFLYKNQGDAFKTQKIADEIGESYNTVNSATKDLAEKGIVVRAKIKDEESGRKLTHTGWDSEMTPEEALE